MKHTKEQLQGMSDSNVEALLNDLEHGFELNYKCYLGDWSDLMPLAVEYKVDINYVGAVCIAEHDCMVQCKDINPQRAIACCLILVLQEKANEN